MGKEKMTDHAKARRTADSREGSERTFTGVGSSTGKKFSTSYFLVVETRIVSVRCHGPKKYM
jgi:hypothetical protein